MSLATVNELQTAMGQVLASAGTARFPILLTGGTDAGKLWVLQQAAGQLGNARLLTGDCRVVDKLPFVLESLLLPMEKELRLREAMDVLDENGCHRLSAVFRGKLDVERVFSRSRSFYGFKHRRDEILQPLDSAREVSVLLEYLSQETPLIIGLRHMELADPLLVRTLEMLPVFRFLPRVLLVYLFDDSRKQGEFSTYVQRLQRDGAPVIHVSQELWRSRIPAETSPAILEALERSRLTPGERLIWLRWKGKQLESAPEHGLELAERLLSSLSVSGRRIFGLLAFLDDDIPRAALQRMASGLDVDDHDLEAALQLAESAGLIQHSEERISRCCDGIFHWIRELTEKEEWQKAAGVVRENRPQHGQCLADQVTEFRLCVAASSWNAAFKQALQLGRSALQLHSASHALRFLNFASESLLPRLERPDHWEMFEFHRFFGNVLVLDHQPERARRQFDVALDLIDRLRDAEADTLRARVFNDIAFLELSTPGGDSRRARRLLTRSLQYAATARNRVSTSNQFGLAHYLDGDLEMARVFFSDNLKMLMMRKGEQEYLEDVDSTLRGLAAIAQRTGELRRALSCVNELVDLHKGQEDLEVMAHTWQYRGMILSRRGDFENAVEDFQRSLDLCDKAGDVFGRARVLINLGETLLLLGETRRAHETLKESLILSREMDNAKGEAICLGQLAQVMILKGRFDEAHAMLGTDRRIAEEINDQYGIAWSMTLKAEAYFWEGKQSHASTLFSEARELAGRRQFLAPMVQSTLGQARCLLLSGEADNAAGLLEELEIRMAHREDPVLEARIQMVRAEVEVARQRLFRAVQFINQAFITFERLGLQFDLAVCRLREARIARIQGEEETGNHRMAEAIALFEKMEANYFAEEAQRLLAFPPVGDQGKPPGRRNE